MTDLSVTTYPPGLIINLISLVQLHLVFRSKNKVRPLSSPPLFLSDRFTCKSVYALFMPCVIQPTACTLLSMLTTHRPLSLSTCPIHFKIRIRIIHAMCYTTHGMHTTPHTHHTFVSRFTSTSPYRCVPYFQNG